MSSPGYDDHLAGHVTYRQADGTLLCNPWMVQSPALGDGEGFVGYWEAMARRELRADPSLLQEG